MCYLLPDFQLKRVNNYQCQHALRHQRKERIYSKYQPITVLGYVFGDFEAIIE